MPHDEQDRIPPFVGGDDPWRPLQPEGEADLAKQRAASQESQLEIALAIEKAFNNGAAREAIAIIRKMNAGIPTYVPGWTVDQIAAGLIRRQAVEDWLAWIETMIEKAREA